MRDDYTNELQRLITKQNDANFDDTKDEGKEVVYRIFQIIKWLEDKGFAPKDDYHGFGQAIAKS